MNTEENKKLQNPVIYLDKTVSEEMSGEKGKGVTLRDKFANSAMQGLISNASIVDDISSSVPEWIAVRSYLIADAMLKERKNVQ